MSRMFSTFCWIFLWNCPLISHLTFYGVHDKGEHFGHAKLKGKMILMLLLLVFLIGLYRFLACNESFLFSDKMG